MFKKSNGSSQDRAVTLLDVAGMAGVSAKTASRVVHGDSRISKATTERVKAAIAELRYHPNIAARALKTKRSFTIALPTTFFASEYFIEVVRGAAQACSAKRRHLVIEDLAGTPGAARAIFDLLDAMPLDGVLLIPPLADDLEVLATLEARGVPYVRIAPSVDKERSGYVTADDAHGVTELVKHLWQVGHRRFGIVAGPPSHSAAHIRRDSFISAVVDLGGSADQVFVFDAPDQIMDSIAYGRIAGTMATFGAMAIDAFLELPIRPTAVFAYSDEVASGVLQGARSRNLSVPGDLAVAGFDDLNVGRILYPPLTSIRQPVAQMAAQAVSMLIDDASPKGHVLPVSLVVRASTLTNARRENP